ncbi:hypothetical protein DL93DRAFT_1635375 [Clavulina sp. PMI_390]|nr:hypothetical protein DL93DRAFT_1635375 [Clavulina sp. PMI_390]
MSPFFASVNLLVRTFSRRTIIISILLFIAFFTFLDTSSLNYRASFIPDAIVDSTNVPFHPQSCDPQAYPSGSIQRKLLTPTIEIDGLGHAWAPENHRQFTALCNCLLTNSCAPNQDKVVLITSHHFGAWYQKSISPRDGGETIWATSTIEALRRLKYTFFFGGSADELQSIYQLLSTDILAIIMSDEHVYNCWDNPKTCVKSPQNPNGLPIWKLFTFHFWSDAPHPLGNLWTLAPEDYAPYSQDKAHVNTFLGYSVEPSCDVQTFIPHVDRPRGRVYAMAKRLSYFAPQAERAWPPYFYKQAARRIQTPGGVHFTIGAANDTKFAEQYHVKIPGMSEFGGDKVITNLGLLDRNTFVEEVAKSRVLLGVGRPAISPTPYQALCLGVPFINPILNWDTRAPDYRGTWSTQHNGLMNIDAPYVYNVRKNDEAGLLSAIRRALENPISRYIPPGKSLPEVAERLHAILRRDWRGEAEQLLGERIRTKGERFTL